MLVASVNYLICHALWVEGRTQSNGTWYRYAYHLEPSSWARTGFSKSGFLSALESVKRTTMATEEALGRTLSAVRSIKHERCKRIRGFG
ncbi:MAG: hypothetical protein KatS3mg083_254 [Candidatus Dojkabacteria bacterium]|nr:MAG: hypothetical protein KatS3mg083_254 [Candidatus Dojkabacteria bacterium]